LRLTGIKLAPPSIHNPGLAFKYNLTSSVETGGINYIGIPFSFIKTSTGVFRNFVETSGGNITYIKDNLGNAWYPAFDGDKPGSSNQIDTFLEVDDATDILINGLNPGEGYQIKVTGDIENIPTGTY
jgi:hypothetical protein